MGSGRLDRRFCAASEGITEHTLQGNDFWVHRKKQQMIIYETTETDGVFRPLHSPSWPLVLFEVSPSWQQSPLCDLPHSPKRIRLQSSTGEIQPCESPLPFSCTGVPIGTYANTHVCAHVCARLLAHKHTVSISLPLTLSLSKYKQLSCRYLCELNVCVWYSD